MVIGDSDFAANQWVSLQHNGDLFFNTIDWLAQDENLISIRPKEATDRHLTLTEAQAAGLALGRPDLRSRDCNFLGSFYLVEAPIDESETSKMIKKSTLIVLVCAALLGGVYLLPRLEKPEGGKIAYGY